MDNTEIITKLNELKCQLAEHYDAVIGEVAKLSGLSVVTVSRVFNGKANPRPSSVKKVYDSCLQLYNEAKREEKQRANKANSKKRTGQLQTQAI